MRVYMKLRNHTKGALRYEEVRKAGEIFTIGEGAPLGSMYMRKSAYPNGKYPDQLIVDIDDGMPTGTGGTAEIPHG